MRGQPSISRIYSMGETRHTEAEREDRLHRYRSHLWHNEGVVVLSLDEITDEWLRQGVENLAKAAYGVRT